MAYSVLAQTTPVRAFQKAAGVTVDGIVGDKTRKAIEAALTPPTADYKALSEAQAVQISNLTAERDRLAESNAVLIGKINAAANALR